MKWFGKKREQNPLCGVDQKKEGATEGIVARVKILGSGCAKCNALEAATREALDELRIETEIEHVTDFTQIAAYGVMTTPALVVNEKVISYGKVLKKEQVKKLLEKEGVL